MKLRDLIKELGVSDYWPHNNDKMAVTVTNRSLNSDCVIMYKQFRYNLIQTYILIENNGYYLLWFWEDRHKMFDDKVRLCRLDLKDAFYMTRYWTVVDKEKLKKFKEYLVVEAI